MRRCSRPALALGLLAGTLTISSACDGEKAVDPAPAAAPAAEPAPAPAPEAAPAPAPAPEAAPAPQAAPAPAPAATPGASGPQVDRARFPDPTWFTPAILPLAGLKSKGHSPPGPDGTFASSMMLEVAHDLSSKDCMATMRGNVDAEIKWADAQTGSDGRITLRGDTERYFVTLVCGQIKGKTVASVNYTWTK